MSIRTHAAPPTIALVVGSRAPLSVHMATWSHAVTPSATCPATATSFGPAFGTAFGTNGVYGTKRATRRLDEPLT